MGFGTYPALSIRQPDLGKTLITAAYLKSTKLKNQLMQGQLGRQKLVQGLGAEIMGGGMEEPGGQLAGAAGVSEGAQPMIDAASPAMRKLIELDPEVGGQYLDAVKKMNEEQRKQYKRLNTITAQMLLMVESAPEQQRPMVYAQVLQKARQQGVSIKAAPPRYNPQWVQNQIRVATALDAELTAVERKARTEGVWVQTAKGKTWMRKDRLEGVVAEADPEKDERTALRKNAEWYAKVTKTSVADAAKLFAQSKAMGPGAFWQKVYLAAVRNFSPPKEASQLANQAVELAFPSGKPGGAAPSPEVAATQPAGGWLARNVPYVGEELQQGLDWLSGETQEMLSSETPTQPQGRLPAGLTPQPKPPVPTARGTPEPQFEAQLERAKRGEVLTIEELRAMTPEQRKRLRAELQ